MALALFNCLSRRATLRLLPRPTSFHFQRAFLRTLTMPQQKRPLPDSVDPAAKRPKNLEKEDDPNTAAPSSGTALGKGKDKEEGGGKDAVEEDWFKGNIYPRVSTIEAADKKDANPPYDILASALEQHEKSSIEHKADGGKCTIFWMRLNDLRLNDNTALHLASLHAKRHSHPLLILFPYNPAEWTAHDRSPRRIDFLLRSLRSLLPSLSSLNIPLLTLPISKDQPRKHVPKDVMAWANKVGAGSVWANMSYEVDELERDIAFLKLCEEKEMYFGLKHDRLILPPGAVQKKGVKGKAGGYYTVFSPWFKVWSAQIGESKRKLLEMRELPEKNEQGWLDKGDWKGLLKEEIKRGVPKKIEGWELDQEDGERMRTIHPEGEETAMEILRRFLTTKAQSSQLGPVTPLPADPPVPSSSSETRAGAYQTDRDRADLNSTSRLSPYLTSGVLSPRQVLNEAVKICKISFPVPIRGTGPGTWISEVAWRDFYNHILAQYPRVSMGQPYKIDMRGVQWETDPILLQAWKEGRTGYPIVDAAMRQANTQGWMHNRARMCAASFLVKDLLVDWRLGERYFMQAFVDGDLASNNGGWQWTASTGTDPQPYFRIFNMTSQAEKADPSGDYIRHFVPELKNLKGKDLYEPHARLSPAAFKALAYPAPIVDHKKARDRALFRFKHVGEKEPGANDDPTAASTTGVEVEGKVDTKGGLEKFGFGKVTPEKGKNTGASGKGKTVKEKEGKAGKTGEEGVVDINREEEQSGEEEIVIDEARSTPAKGKASSSRKSGGGTGKTKANAKGTLEAFGFKEKNE